MRLSLHRTAAVCALAASALACGGTDPAPPATDVPHAAPAPFGGQVCSPERYCWYAPLPSGSSVHGLWGSGWNDLWAVGDSLLHFDGNGWSMDPFPLAPGETLEAIAGSSAKDVWAGGDRLLHFDGSAWSQATGTPDGTILALAAWSGGALAILDTGDGRAEQQSILEKRGSGPWTTVLAPTAPDLRGLWIAPDGGEAWVVGLDLGTLGSRALHRTAAGQPFTSVSVPGAGNLLSLWGSAGDLWAGGLSGTLVHWDGKAWTQAAGIDPKAELRALWGSGKADVYASSRGSAWHYDGTSWKQVTPPVKDDGRLFRAVWGSGSHNLWLAGDSGALWQGDNGVFADATSGTFPFLEAVSASGPANAWAVGGAGAAIRWDGHYWVATNTFVTDPLQAVFTVSTSSAWAAGASFDCQGFLLHFDGARWSTAVGPDAQRCYTGLSGTSGTDLWAVAAGILLHYDGTKWLDAGPADPAQAVWAAAPGEVFVLQDSPQGGANAPGGVWHLKGGTWTLDQTGAAASLRALWGASAADVWASGDDGTQLFHFDGKGWSATSTPLGDGTVGLGSLWGSGPSDVWAASRLAPILLHWDGHRWSQSQASAGFKSVSGMGGSGPADVWFVGTDGAIFHKGQ
jgi:hypothetical protein